MRRVIIIFCGLVLIAAIVGFVLIRQGGGREKPLPDGSFIRIEKVAFDKEEHFRLGGGLQKVKDAVTEFWRAHISHSPSPMGAGTSSWYMNTATHSNQPALYIYISRREPGKGYRSVDAQTAQLIDEDGCGFAPTQSGGWDDGKITTPSGPGGMRYSVGWFRFEAFPRRDQKFRFILHADNFGSQPASTHPGSVEFTVENPAPPPPAANWSVEPLPITRTWDKVSFALTHVKVETFGRSDYWSGHTMEPQYKLTEDGKPSTNWQAVSTELYDISGNFVAEQYSPLQSLCPREAAWKLSVRFFGSEKSGSASNAVWTLRGLAVPGPGVSTPINQSNILQGVLVTAGAFGGSGDFTYSNCIALKAGPSETEAANRTSAVSWPNSWLGKRSVTKPTFSLHTKTPHLVVDIGDLSDDQRFTACAVDDKGREYYGHKVYDAQDSRGVFYLVRYLSNWYESEGGFVIFDLPDDIKTVDLHLCVHTCHTAEFIFKPPQPGAPPGK
jgi:hypothetical protein